jgi:PAS domain S-box-containing protein
MTKCPKNPESLREQAERFFRKRAELAESHAPSDIDELLHELSVHQIELEIQNDELQRAQAELERSRAKYFDLYNLAPAGYFTLTSDGKILEANLTAATLLRIGKTQLLNRPLSQFVAPESQDALYFHLKNALKTGLQQTCDVKFLRPNNETLYLHLESVVSAFVTDGASQLRISAIDITENKCAQEILKESAIRNELLLNALPHPAMLIDKDRKIVVANDRAKRGGAEVGEAWHGSPVRSSVYRGASPGHQERFLPLFSLADGEEKQARLVTVVEDSNDAVTVLDIDGNIKAWNKQAEKIYGFSAAEALTMNLFDLVPSRQKAETLHLLHDIQSGVLVKPFETRRMAKDGCILDIRLTVTPLFQNGKIAALATTERDISEYNRWLASIRKLPQRIIVAQEKERSRISQEIHSDFGQSLMALKMFVTMSAGDFPPGNLQVGIFCEQIKSRLSGIIQKTRELAHELAPPSLKYVGLVRTLKSLIDTAAFDKKITMTFFHRHMVGVSFEEKDIIIYRIVQESLLNIFKHARATKVRIKMQRCGAEFLLEIRDNGKGFLVSGPQRTRGLGLDLMRAQVVLIHGTLAIETQPGKGTTIAVTMPIKERKNT